ncbi:hypothetical protein NW768_012106 [Fusarium equiseti]|uniref:Uncharacterized protein n=1 Tax=Fusarium equiseti TaxID=61235 RepID=A0ABQ8QVP6_FUSEQ|nr:hypothetical protein NW768_012106 [Fusarium equiseti]
MLEGLGTEYRVADVREYVTQAIDVDGCLAPALDLARAGEFDRKSLRKLGVLFSSPDFVKRRDLPSHDPLLKFSKDDETEELSIYINDNWKINSSLFDTDLKAVRGEDYGIFTTLEFLPVSVVNSFKSVVDTPYLTIPDFGEILDTISQSLSDMGSRLTVELIMGGMGDVMDRIRFGMLEHRAEPTVHAIASKQYPRTYDRIHISNIP